MLDLKLIKKTSFIFVFVLVSVLVHAQNHHAQGHHAPHWSYDGEAGPEHWGDLTPEYSTCKTGLSQSPINITNAVSASLPPIDFHYSPSPLKITDNGHTVQVTYAPGSYLVAGGKRYDLVQFHFHHPSEEQINGSRADLVIHLVHKSAEGKLAVVAVLFDEGTANPAMEAVVNKLPAVKEHELLTDATVNAEDILPSKRSYYAFSGSLTTPPCTEGVQWFVMQTRSMLSKSALERLAKLYPDNTRPVQPLNGRVVEAGS
ncbi:MAG TPA: carbonic anhydrase family protein [Clostridia bacterium]|nr:carbonic anhydrase family protein [Clostridia bacterium]